MYRSRRSVLLEEECIVVGGVYRRSSSEFQAAFQEQQNSRGVPKEEEWISSCTLGAAKQQRCAVGAAVNFKLHFRSSKTAQVCRRSAS